MSNPAKPAWPDPGALAFSLFGNAASSPTSSDFVQPFTQGLAGGVDFMKKLWGQVPGNTAVPGFLVPTLDVDELDKRISDLKAAESWLEVNLNLLRATIQGLEVQRHTIAAIRSLGALPDAPQSASSPAPLPGGLPPGWPVARTEDKSTEVPTTRETPQAAKAEPVEAERLASAPERNPSGDDGDESIDPPAAATRQAARKTTSSPTSRASTEKAMPGSPLAGLTANHWLGYMQDQFAKVAQAALASPVTGASNDDRKAAVSPARKSAAKTSAKAAVKRRPATGKKRVAR